MVTLASVTVREEGDWACLLTNTAGQSRARQVTSVLVLRLPRLRLEVVGGSQTEGVVVVETSPSSPSPANITLSCSLEAEHQTRHQARPDTSSLESVHWYLDNLLLHTLPLCPSPQLCHVDPTKLVLENVNRHFQGNFSCAGSLSSGLTSEMSNLLPVTVLFPPGQASLAVSPRSALYSGDQVTFTCSLQHQGRPRAEGYRWRLGGREVDQEDSARLTVSLRDSETGQTNVSCLGYNQAGPGPAALLELEVMTGPRLTQSLPPRSVVRDDEELQLVCEVVCLPGCELRWYREGRLLKHSDSRVSINRTISYQNKRKYYR